MQQEEQRIFFRKLAFIFHNNQNLNTTHVAIINKEGKKVDITEKENMEKYIIEENRYKYHQTEDTCPFLQYPMRSHFGDFGEGPAAESVLNGQYTPPFGISPETAEFIKQCKHKDIPDSKLNRSFEYYRQSWRKMRENTGTNGHHFGHYKAGMRNDMTVMVHFIMAETPFRSGYPPPGGENAQIL
jgi:hypothetical protein